MKLSSLEIASSLRLTQPSIGDETQVLDIEFDITRGAAIDTAFYNLCFLNLLNGYVSGEDDASVTTGLKFTFYDATGALIAQSFPAKMDKVMDEAYTRLEVVSETIIPDSTVDIFIGKVKVSYVGNDAGLPVESVIFNTSAPSTSIFAESNGAGKNGVLLAKGYNTKATSKFSIYFKA